jgi:adenosylcobyric acid synthase
VAGAVNASDYHRRRVRELFATVVASYERLASRHAVIVLEGAGSPAEVNLSASDIVNMRMARAADAACLLVADIDRGGVFASLVGTFELLSHAERKRVRGFIVNRFRGDPKLFLPGVKFLERRLRRPCLGIVPYLHGLGLDEEDGVALEPARRSTPRWPEEASAARPLRVAVVAFPFISNFTDFDPLAAEPSVALAFARRPADIVAADVVILPGTKQTLDDLAWLRKVGLARAVRDRARRRQPVIGICGGMQMLGHEIRDPHGMEGGGRRAGLGLLPIRTTLGREKVTGRARAHLAADRLFGRRVRDGSCHGYEIHLGATRYDPGAHPLFRIRRERSAGRTEDGASSEDGYVIGTYMHGFFDHDAFRHTLLKALRASLRLASPATLVPFTADREQRLDRWAAHVRGALDVERIKGWLR